MDHNYKIIAVDFDGTLCYSNWPELAVQERLSRMLPDGAMSRGLLLMQ